MFAAVVTPLTLDRRLQGSPLDRPSCGVLYFLLLRILALFLFLPISEEGRRCCSYDVAAKMLGEVYCTMTAILSKR